MNARPDTPGRELEPFEVTALFDDPEAVDRTITRLVGAGVPRDLVEVAVAPEAARQFYGERASPPGRDALRYAGVGALVGLLLGGALSLLLVALPGVHDPDDLLVVQLLGPNFGTVSGAVIGAALGLFVRRRPERRYARAAEAPGDIVVVVTTRSDEEAAAVSEVLTECGGRDPRVER